VDEKGFENVKMMDDGDDGESLGDAMPLTMGSFFYRRLAVRKER